MNPRLLIPLLLLTPTALGASSAPYRVSVPVRMAADVHAGRLSPPPPDLREHLTAEEIAVTVRFDRELGEEELRALERRGARLSRMGGEVLHVGSIYTLRLPWRLLDELSRESRVRRIEAAHPRYAYSPLNVSRPEVTAPALHALRGETGPLTGEGALILDLDTGIDVGHPAFFRPDGGNFEWLDHDGDGAFTAEVDGVDLDADGQLGAGESLSLLENLTLNFYLQPVDIVDGELNADVDWVFVDVNGDGIWNHGVESGFTTDDPAFGEPIFIVEDLDDDHALSPGERLMMLGSSRVEGVLDGDNTEFLGEHIISASPDTNGHGTSVAGILAGEFHRFRRYAGVAPGARLLSANVFENTSYLDAMAWGAAQGPDVMLHEIGMWSAEFLDGSSNIERAVADWSDQGIVQVCPAGNIGENYRHGTVDVKSSTAYQGPWNLDYPASLAAAGSLVYYVTVQARVDLTKVTPLFERPLPDGSPGSGDFITVPVTDTQSCKQDTQSNVVCGYHDRSEVGTDLWQFVVYRTSGSNYVPPTTGLWSVWFKNRNTGTVRLQLWTADDKTSWGGGASFVGPASVLGPEYIGNAFTSVTSPAVVAECITVGSYSTRVDTFGGDFEGGSFDVSFFSGRGPRLDGVALLDVAAPGHYDVVTSASSATVGRDGASVVFGGTSAAGPHVAGIAAILKQQDPDLTPAEISVAIKGGAGRDSFTGTALPDEEWGAGKLRGEAARDAADQRAPGVGVRVLRPPLTPERVELVISPDESLKSAPTVVLSGKTYTASAWTGGLWRVSLAPAPPPGTLQTLDVTAIDKAGNAQTQELSVTF